MSKLNEWRREFIFVFFCFWCWHVAGMVYACNVPMPPVTLKFTAGRVLKWQEPTPTSAAPSVASVENYRQKNANQFSNGSFLIKDERREKF